MSIEIIPRINPGNLSKILESLPEPTSLDVFVCGSLDYDPFSAQINSSIKFKNPNSNNMLLLGIENPTKERLLEIHKADYEFEGKPSSSVNYHARIGFFEAMFYDEMTQIKITPWRVNIDYRGLEPESVKKVREAVNGLDIPLTISVRS